MIKTILLGLLGLLVLLLAYAATRPDTFRVERSALVQAPPDKVFGLINDLQKFNTWNPYAKKDPAIKGSYGGSTQGPGASYSWESEKVGTGSMTIQDATPAKVTMQLDFRKPFEARNTGEFTLVPESGGTRVTWAMYGPANYMSKLMDSLTLLDRMVGNDFASGLADLKGIAEAR